MRIRVPIGTQADALLVPDRALSTDQQGQYLLIVGPDNVVEHRAVEVGTTRRRQPAVINSGLKPGEQFIVEGLQFARPGRKVTPVSKSSAKASEGETKQPAASPGKAGEELAIGRRRVGHPWASGGIRKNQPNTN